MIRTKQHNTFTDLQCGLCCFFKKKSCSKFLHLMVFAKFLCIITNKMTKVQFEYHYFFFLIFINLLFHTRCPRTNVTNLDGKHREYHEDSELLRNPWSQMSFQRFKSQLFLSIFHGYGRGFRMMNF